MKTRLFGFGGEREQIFNQDEIMMVLEKIDLQTRKIDIQTRYRQEK